MGLGHLVAITLGLVLTGVGLPAYAQEPQSTRLTMDSEKRFADLDTPVVITLLTEPEGAPVASAEVLVERRTGDVWTEVGVVTTDETGRAEVVVTLARRDRDNAVRVTYAGDETYAPDETVLVLPLKRRDTRLGLRGPDQVVDEQSVELTIRWRTLNGTPVQGPVELHKRSRGGEWTRFRRTATDEQGLASFSVRPRTDTTFRAIARRLDWVKAAQGRHRVENVPPGTPVNLPRAAPKPRVNLPDQARAVGDGANPTVTRISNRVWNQMTGRSWHRGCPVGRAGLRLLRINYWAYDGYRHRGEVVAHVDAVDNMRGALAEMYARQLPIRSMYRVDRFGWSRRLQGADDYRSMASGNTSAFNCRHVVGRPGVRSPHSYGRSLDINPWENPYRASGGWVPNSWWVSRSHPRVAWRSREHAVVTLMARHGLRWTYGTQDAHHFDVPARSGRVIAAQARACDTTVCH